MPDPRITSVDIAVDAKTWYDELRNNGLLALDNNQFYFEPNVRAVFTALHEVLAGGTVSITVTTPGSSTIKNDLEEALNMALATSNELIEEFGSDVVYP